MIRRHNEMTVETASNVKGGKGTIQLTSILNEDEMNGAGSFFGLTVIPPGCSTGEHTHTDDFETYYIISGTAEVNDNGELAVLRAGDMAQCRIGCYHAIRNVGDTNLEYLAVKLYKKEG